VGTERDTQGFRDPFDLVHAELGVHWDGELALEEIRRDRARLLRVVYRLLVARPRTVPAADALST
jgi:hypothetical protein